MKNLLISIALCGLAGVAFSGSAQAAPTHCASQEKIIFSCSVGKKIVSVCASSLSPDRGTLQYRFGPKGAPELLYPNPATHPKTIAKAGSQPYSGGGASHLRFIKEGYSYIVYAGIGKGWEKEGLVVEKEGKLVSHFECKNRAISELGPDFFRKENIPEDDQEFEVP